MRLVINFIFVAAAKIRVQQKEGQMWHKEWEKNKDTVIPLSGVLHFTLDGISDGKKGVLKH